MLHILWLLIKIILILLGVALGLVLLLLLALLFVPVRYRAFASRQEEKFRAEARAGWLLGGLSLTVSLDGASPRKELRILGLSTARWKRLFRRGRKKKRRPPNNRGQKKASPPQMTGGSSGQAAQPPSQAPAAPSATPSAASPSTPPAIPPAAPSAAVSGKKGPLHAFFSRVWQILKTVFLRLAALPGKCLRFFLRLWDLPGRLAGTFGKIALTIRGICDKINYWIEFFQEERTRCALRHIWTECRLLLRQAAPRRITGQVIFGTEDPALTGEILAGIGITCPIHRNCVQIVPVFDRKVLEGEIRCRGRIYGITLLRIAWRLYFDQNIKYIWNRWNHKEG